MTMSSQYPQFQNLTYEGFQELARNPELSCYEKIGFPNCYREGKEERIFEDIQAKLPNLKAFGKIILDIGPGCSHLPQYLITLCRDQGHTLLLVDSEEMLSHLPDEPFIHKFVGAYPTCADLLKDYLGKIDVILAYSVFHYIFEAFNPWYFQDQSMQLLADGGEMLIGDIPNLSKRKRFFSSANGIQFHQNFTQSQTVPEVTFNQVESGSIDDTVIFSLLSRARASGVDAYVLPQSDDLPMANRREDILLRKP